MRDKWKLSSRFNDPRDTRIGRHEAWDIGCPEGTAIFAPEEGFLIYHAILRSGPEDSAWWAWPDGNDYWFSNYYLDTYGCLLILFGRTYTHVFCHINLDDLMRLLEASGKQYTAKKHKSTYNRWVRAYLNLVDPRQVVEGEKIGFVGTEGHESGPHIHYELHPCGFHTWKRLDPKVLWPAEYAAGEGGT